MSEDEPLELLPEEPGPSLPGAEEAAPTASGPFPPRASPPIPEPPPREPGAPPAAGGKPGPPAPEEEPWEPPSPLRGEWWRLLSWSFRGRNGAAFAAGLLGLLLALFVIDFMGRIPLLGLVIRVLTLAPLLLWALAYPLRTAATAVEGEREPPAWPSLFDETSPLREGARVLGLLFAYESPALVVGIAGQGAWLVIPLALLGYGLFPAALLGLAVHGSLLRANPVRAFRTARAGGGAYLLALTPVPPFLVALLLTERPAGRAMLETGCLAALVITAGLLGFLARENLAVGDTVLLYEEAGPEAEADGDSGKDGAEAGDDPPA